MDTLKDDSTMKDDSTIRPMHPLWLIPICLVGGLVAGGPFAGAVLHQCGYRRLGQGLGWGLLVAGSILLTACGLWSVQWYWVALCLTSIHLVCGVVLFLVARGPYRAFQANHPPESSERGTYRSTFSGVVGGALIGGLLGTVLAIPYVLLCDRLFSTFMPTAFDDFMVIYRVVTGGVFMTVSGAVAGGFLGRFRPRITPARVLFYALLLVWAHQTWMLCVDTAIAMPSFQALGATGEAGRGSAFPLVLLELAIGSWWTVFLLFFTIVPPKLSGKLVRAGLALGMNMAAAATIAITFGYPADLLLGLGKHFERGADTAKALWCYELGLKKEPKPFIASSLQYRVALLNHKLGQQRAALEGFNRVVAKYNANESLVKKANRFLDSMDRKSGGKRVVLPGVETRTEYKGGYCVPNSLALVMRYWGKDISAGAIGRRITGLGSGTIVVDQRWFAEQEGWRHDFLPVAGVDDIKRCIDAGFPVLVYVPAHVFAIVGYDEALETFVTYDVATRDVWEEYVQKDFVKSWKKQASTLVLSYPPERGHLIPEDIRRRLEGLSDDYLHFQLHYFDAPESSISIPHLTMASGASGAESDFFFPLTVMYAEFPSLRPSLDEAKDPHRAVEAIKAYFWNDFDEGIHLAGQHYDERWARPDWALECAVSYLIGHDRYDLVEALISRIDDQGRVSPRTMAEIGLMELSKGEYRRGLDRIRNSGQATGRFYAGLAELEIGNEQGAVRELVKVVDGKT